MRPGHLAIHHSGLVTSLGLTTASTCAALRAGVTNPTPTRFMGIDGEWIMAHQVDLGTACDGLQKLVAMAALAIQECLEDVPSEERDEIPLLLCVAEPERPGRLNGLENELVTALRTALAQTFHPDHTSVIACGRPGAVVALARARQLLHDHGCSRVVIAATDSMLVWQTLTAYGDQERLLAEHNSNGFMPGEAAGALLVGPARGGEELICLGVGQGIEPAPLRSGEPLRAEGLTAAIREALRDARCEMHDLDFRVTDISGEQYFFKEASLAFARTMRRPKDEFDLWHPAEGIGEAGAAVGPVMIATALTACHKRYATGTHILIHGSSDGVSRAAAIVAWTGVWR